MRRIILLLIVVTITYLALSPQPDSPSIFVTPPEITSDSSYQGAHPAISSVTILDDLVEQITQIEITPDGQFMLAATLKGQIFVYHRQGDHFVRQLDPFYTLETAQPGFPPEEAGLSGLVLGSDFASSGDIFLLYSFARGENDLVNRITRLHFTESEGKVFGTNPFMIFEAATQGAASHQIQDGVGVMVKEEPHLLFSIGEGHDPKRSLDASADAGKLMLIRQDGSDPLGERPYPDNSKVQAIGVRNAPGIALSSSGTLALADTGPDNYDRLLVGPVFDPKGVSAYPLSMNWDGTEASLEKRVSNPYQNGEDLVIHRWAPTETAVNIAFYKSRALPDIGPEEEYLLLVLFGRTGDTSDVLGRKIVLGVLNQESGTLTLAPFITRTVESVAELGHPLGLAIDPLTNNMYFGDIIEGRIYQITLSERR